VEAGERCSVNCFRCRMVKRTVHLRRSDRRGESFSSPYAEVPSDVRPTLVVLFTILLCKALMNGASPSSSRSWS
jgi:hypothetical protein